MLNFGAIANSNIYEAEQSDIYQEAAIHDPYENINRKIFKFNQEFNHYITYPIIKIYNIITPGYLRNRISDEILFMREPIFLANAILTLNPKAIETSVGRILINLTFGILGLFDVASSLGLEPTHLTFSNTVYHYTKYNGPFLVVPLLGGSSLSGFAGLGVDKYLWPFTYITADDFQYGYIGAAFIDAKYRYHDAEVALEQSALDEYAAFRSVYLQKRL